MKLEDLGTRLSVQYIVVPAVIVVLGSYRTPRHVVGSAGFVHHSRRIHDLLLLLLRLAPTSSFARFSYSGCGSTRSCYMGVVLCAHWTFTTLPVVHVKYLGQV